MKITQTEDKVIFEFPRWKKRQNPYMEEESDKGLLGEYPTFTGLIWRNRQGVDEIGFAYTIDMDYKDKGDQVGCFAVMWDGEEEDFRKKCKGLGIRIHEI